ncbi:hypothetical protein DUT91_00870 [Phyllobacterium salinisoli]|uniref:DUF1127 domain-containing protein n=2 Tax=Phyllobacterium salinisoli TaxID=1899321 RepID=A0A368K9V1_9HYPH|nr:hypothetical protein DUT91_00870 [Phyllobacterium salinisoli]
MTTCDRDYLDNYSTSRATYADRLVRFFESTTLGVARTYREKVALIAARKRQRDTVRALAYLPENILQDIGWPDLYERQQRKTGK